MALHEETRHALLACLPASLHIYLVIISIIFFSFFKSDLQALGMESGAILDGNIHASSSKTDYEAWKGRLNGNSCWMPAQNKYGQYITVSFATKVTIVAIATQGAPLDGCWVKSYQIRWGYQNTKLSLPKVKTQLFTIPNSNKDCKYQHCGVFRGPHGQKILWPKGWFSLVHKHEHTTWA